MKILLIFLSLILMADSGFAAEKKKNRRPAQKTDKWEIKEVANNQVTFKNPDIEPVILESGYSGDDDYTAKVVGVMSDSEDIPTIIYEVTTYVNPDPDLRLTRPVVNPKKPGKIEKWEFANSNISLAQDSPAEGQPANSVDKVRLLYGECLEPNHRVILSIRNKSIKFTEPEKFMGAKRSLSSNGSQNNLDPSFAEIQEKITSGKCKEIKR